MKTVKINAYEYHELDKQAQERATNDHCEIICEYYDMSDDFRESLKAFEGLTNTKCKRWEVDSNYYNFHVDCGCNEEELTGKHLFRWVNREILPYLWKGKYRSKGTMGDNGKYSYKSYRSNVLGSYDDCALTGIATDCMLVKCIVDYCKNWPAYGESYDFSDLMNECYDALFSEWESSLAYAESSEAAEEFFANNDYLFDKGGRTLHLEGIVAE